MTSSGIHGHHLQAASVDITCFSLWSDPQHPWAELTEHPYVQGPAFAAADNCMHTANPHGQRLILCSERPDLVMKNDKQQFL